MTRSSPRIDAIQPARGRRALVLLSDGSDRYSTATAAEVLARARAADVLDLSQSRSAAPGQQLFAELASLTGGRSSHVEDARRLPETLRTIATELRNQYLIGYSPVKPIVAGSNEWRSIAVTVHGPASASARAMGIRKVSEGKAGRTTHGTTCWTATHGS